jgi:tetratricopeptide (TPR) repeat protein
MSEREILAARRRALGLDHRDTLETMDALATTLASEGKFEEAKRLLDERLTITRRKPDQDGLAEGLYSYACAAAIAGHPDEALEQLRRAIDHGYTDVRHIAADKDLISLRGNPRFENLVAAAQNAVPVQPKTD